MVQILWHFLKMTNWWQGEAPQDTTFSYKNFFLKQPLVFKTLLCIFFDSRNSKIIWKFSESLLVLNFENWAMVKSYQNLQCCEKKDVVLQLSKLFSNHTFKYYKFKLVKKWAQFLFWFSQNLQLKSDNFSEPILLNYCSLILQYMKFLFEKTFFVFDRFSNKIILKYRLTFV